MSISESVIQVIRLNKPVKYLSECPESLAWIDCAGPYTVKIHAVNKHKIGHFCNTINKMIQTGIVIRSKIEIYSCHFAFQNIDYYLSVPIEIAIVTTKNGNTTIYKPQITRPVKGTIVNNILVFTMYFDFLDMFEQIIPLMQTMPETGHIPCA